MKRSFTAALSLLLLGTLLLAACGGPKEPKKGEVIVYVAVPLSGFQANGGQTVLGGASESMLFCYGALHQNFGPADIAALRSYHDITAGVVMPRAHDAGEVATQAEIARREGITRARVTQVLGLLRLAPEIQEHILGMQESAHRPTVTERAVRHLVKVENIDRQISEFARLID